MNIRTRGGPATAVNCGERSSAASIDLADRAVIRVLSVFHRADLGGVPSHMEAMHAALLTEGVRSEYVLGASGSNDLAVDQLRRVGATVHPAPYLTDGLTPIAVARSATRLRRLVQELEPDLVAAHSSFAGAICRLLPSGYPVIYTPHCWAFLTSHGRLRRLAYTSVERALRSRSAATVAVSAHDYCSGIEQGASSFEKTFLIPNSLPDIAPTGRAPVARHGQKDSEHRLKLISIARLEQPKDFGTVLRALALLPSSMRPEFTLVGDGPQRRGLQVQADQLGVDVTLTGHHANASSIIPEHDIFILSSEWESMPMTILEAMRASRPTIASSVGGVPELIDPGFDGWLYEPGDEENLASVLAMLHDRRDMIASAGDRARERYETRHHIDTAARRLAGVYRWALLRC